MKIDRIVGQVIIVAAVGLDFYLELHGKAVPVSIGLLAGVCLRHLMADDAPTTGVKTP